MQAVRGGVPKPFEGYPAYGAAHPVMPNQQLRGLLFDTTRIADFVLKHSIAGVSVDPVEFGEGNEHSLVLPERVAELFGEGPPFDEAADPDDVPDLPPEAVYDYDPRKFYRVFDPDTLGVTVVEMDPSEKAARAVRTVWEKQDFGAVENEVKSELGRRAPNTVPKLFIARADTVGKLLPGAESQDVRQKVALFPEAHRSQETLDLMENEASVLYTAINSRLRQFMRPWDIVPHITYMLFRNPTKPKEIELVVESINNYLNAHPFAVRLDSLELRHKTTRSVRK